MSWSAQRPSWAWWGWFGAMKKRKTSQNNISLPFFAVQSRPQLHLGAVCKQTPLGHKCPFWLFFIFIFFSANPLPYGPEVHAKPKAYFGALQFKEALLCPSYPIYHSTKPAIWPRSVAQRGTLACCGSFKLLYAPPPLLFFLPHKATFKGPAARLGTLCYHQEQEDGNEGQQNGRGLWVQGDWDWVGGGVECSFAGQGIYPQSKMILGLLDTPQGRVQGGQKAAMWRK